MPTRKDPKAKPKPKQNRKRSAELKASGGGQGAAGSEAPRVEERAGKERGGDLDSLNAYIREISRYKPLPSEQEKELGRRIQAGDRDALNELVVANLRFVVSYAKRYRGLGLSFLDLINEGNLGLMEAAKRFDPERNVKFISYAVWWVRQAIFHSLSEHTRVFRLPQKLSGQVSRVSAARDRLAARLERNPTLEEIGEELGIRREEVDWLLMVGGEDLSLSTSVGEDGNLELGDTIEQETIPAVEVELIRASFNSQIQSIVDELDEKERQVLRMRFGLDGEEPRTLQEIGETLKLSRERIRQIESKAKEKLRRNQQAQGLRGYLN
jgi:RNA polymerase primary sigma factor